MSVAVVELNCLFVTLDMSTIRGLDILAWAGQQTGTTDSSSSVGVKQDAAAVDQRSALLSSHPLLAQVCGVISRNVLTQALFWVILRYIYYA